MADLAIIIVSSNDAEWLKACLPTVFEHAGSASIDVVVANNSSTDDTVNLVELDFPAARVVTCENRGFGHANNRAFETTDAPFVLFLNPDTEILSGTFDELLDDMRRRPDVGVLGVPQHTADGAVFPTIRRFPSVRRFLGEALAAEKLPFHSGALGERELDMSHYERETDCDWVSGSFMLVRREALESAGVFDERFFLFAEEVDLCLRVKEAGWRIVHVPTMRILHHADKTGYSERSWMQEAFAKRQYVEKHFGTGRRGAALVAIGMRYAIRAVAPSTGEADASARRHACRAALATLVGKRPPPFVAPPRQALWPRE